MEKENPDSKHAARQGPQIASFRQSRSKTHKRTQGSTPLTTQLPTPAMEEVTPLAASNITSMYPDNPKGSSSIESIISSIETALPAPIPLPKFF